MRNRIIGIFSPTKIFNTIFFLFLIICITLIGCRSVIKVEYPEKTIVPPSPWSLHDYAEFLKENMKYRDEIYSTEYIDCNLVVDTDFGSTPIQNLIDPNTVFSIVDTPIINNMNYYDRILYICEYVLREYNYHAEPHYWQTVDETIKAKKGDCNDLSLLLMSLLVSAGINAHASISNFHMWVNVFYDNEWHVLETDKDLLRNRIYQIPNFYKNPLFKVFIDGTQKRKRF